MVFITCGLGGGTGKRAVEETKEEIQEAIKGADMVFITCGLGGGTGTGAAPIIARISREMGALTVGVVTKPFFFEGQQRMKLAEAGLEELRQAVDAIIVIPNDRLLSTISKETTAKSAFATCDDVLKSAVEGISDLITTPGIINIDFADIKATMENAGSALMGIGTATGEKRAEDAGAGDQAHPGDLANPHPADDQRHHRPGMWLHHQFAGAAKAGGVWRHHVRVASAHGGQG
jgi:cell division protein FtsZ